MVVGTASAEYVFYWQVDQSESEEPIAFDYAALYSISVESGEAAMIGDRVAGSLAEDPTASGAINTVVDPMYVTGDNTFQVRLFGEDNAMIGLGLTYAWDDLLEYVYSSMGQAGATPMHVGDFASVPEPTSGLLLLLGLAGLALRRRV